MANYLYNGKELPDINTVWTDELKTQHPYAAICRMTTGYKLIICGELLRFNGVACYSPNDGTAQSSNCASFAGAEAWDEFKDATGDTWVSPIWSNHDILNSDGTLYLAASDPIPVTINPTTFYFLSGLLFAQKVRLPLVYKQFSLNGL